MKQLYQLLKTGYKERKVLLMTSILIAAIRLGLLLLPFQRLLKLLDRFSQQNNTVRLSVRKIFVVG